MDQAAWWRAAAPLVLSLGDGHTRVLLPTSFGNGVRFEVPRSGLHGHISAKRFARASGARRRAGGTARRRGVFG